MTADLQRDQALVARFCESHPQIAELAALCKSHKLRLYLTGGTIRDLLLGLTPSADLDLFIEGDRNAAAKVRESFLSNRKQIADSAHPDIKISGNVKLFVQQYDFTVNAIVYDLINGALSSPSGGIEDLRAKRLRANATGVFVMGPLHFVRAFRLALELNLALDEQLVQTITRFGSLTGIARPPERVKLIAEMLRIFSHTTTRPIHEHLVRTQILSHVFPFLRVFEYVQATTRTGTVWERNLEALRAIDGIIGRLSQVRSAGLEMSQPLELLDMAIVPAGCLNARALARLAVLLSGLGGALSALGGKTPEHLKSIEFQKHSHLSVINVLADSVKESPALMQFIRGAGLISAAQLDFSEALDESGAKPSGALLQRASALSSLALIEATKVKPKPEMLAAIERGLD